MQWIYDIPDFPPTRCGAGIIYLPDPLWIYRVKRAIQRTKNDPPPIVYELNIWRWGGRCLATISNMCDLIDIFTMGRPHTVVLVFGVSSS